MPNNERSTDLILRAQVDQAIQPLSQVTSKIKELTASLEQQRKAASDGVGSTREYDKALKDLIETSNQLILKKEALIEFSRRQEALEKQQQSVDTRRAKRDEFAASLPDPSERTAAQTNALNRMDKALEAPTRRLTVLNESFQKSVDQLTLMGVLTDQLDAKFQRLALDRAHAEISSAQLQAAQAVQTSREERDPFAKSLQDAAATKAQIDAEQKLADVEQQLASKRVAEAEKATAAHERRTRELLDEARLLQDLRRDEAFTSQVQTGRGISREDIQAAFDAEAARLQQEKELVALATRNAEQEQKQAAERVAASAKVQAAYEKETQDLLTKARLLEEIRRDEAFTTQVQAGRGISREDIQAAFDADTALRAEEKALGLQRKADADDFQKQQRETVRMLREVWEEDDKASAKARQNMESFREAVRRAQEQVAALRAAVASHEGALSAPVVLPAPTLAGQVRERLAPTPAPGVNPADMAAVQRAVMDIHSAIFATTAGIDDFAKALKDLDAVSNQITRQSVIVDSFVKQKAAADAARKTFDELVVEIKRLDAAAATLTNPQEIQEVTSKANQLRRGLDPAGERARETTEALAVEEVALNKIGVSADRVGDAITRYTNLATTTSRLRTEALVSEKEELDHMVDARVRAAQAVTMPVAGALPRSARSAVEAVGIASRGTQPIDDTSAAVAKLDEQIGKGKLTLQTFNKVMDETYAIQRQIASDASLIDQYSKQSAATDKLRLAFDAAKMEVERLGAAVKAGTANLSDLTRAEQRLEATRGNLQAQVVQQAQLGAALNARRISTTALAAETDKLTASAQRLAAAQARAQGGQGGLFGLSPYQLQNLSFQANDVFTQLSLGQGVMQTFLSQGPQIFQIFETSIASMKAWIPVIGVAVAAIATLASAFERASNADKSFRQFSATLAGTVDAASRSASMLLGLQRNAERLGITFAEAGKTVRTFLTQDLSTERIEQFTKAAIDMSTAFGITVEEATKRLSIIPAGSIDDLEKFLLELKLLTPELVKFFEARRADGDIDAARVATINLITDALTKQRAEAITPTSEAVIQLKNSWHDLQEEIANTQQVRNFNRIWARDLVIISGVLDTIRGTLQGLRTSQGENPALKRTQDEVARLSAAFTKAMDNALAFKEAMKANDDNPVFKRMLDQVEELAKKLNVARDALKSLQEATSSPEGGPTTIPGVSPQGRGLANNPAAAALIDNTAATMGLSVAVRDFATRIAQIESGGRQLNSAGGILTSSAGALGSMQVMPDAALANAPPGASRTGRTITGGPAPGFYDLTDPVQNVKAGLAELARLFVKYNGDLAKVAGGYVGEGTSASAIRQRTEYLAKLGLGGATTTYGGATGTGMTGTQATQQAEAANEMLRNKLERELDELRGRAAKAMLGNNAQRIEADNKSLELYYEQQIEAAQKELGTAELTAATRAKIAEKVQIEMERLAQIRTKEDLAITKEGDALVRSLQDRIAAADKTNAENQRQAARNAGQAGLDQVAIFRNQNVQNVGGMTLDAYEAKLKSEILTAVEKATIDADKAIIDAVIKERDDRTKTIVDQLQHGTITLEEAFRQTAQVVNASSVKIKEAVDRSNADLRAQPQTAKIQQQLAANARIDPRDAKAFDALEQQGLSKINDLVSARNIREATYIKLVQDGRMSAKDADVEINKLYASTRKGIDGAVQSQRDMIEELHNTKDPLTGLSLISDEVYERMKAKIDSVAASTDNLTAHQRKMIDEFSGVIVSQAITGIEGLAEAMGKLIVGTASWGDTLKTALQVFGQFVAGVLKGIAEIILKEELMAIVKTALRAVSGGSSGLVDTVSTFHSGGIVGAGTMSRPGLSAAVWRGAVRAHTGGLLGLAPGEMPIIANQGEEVLTKDDPRHRNNARPGKEVTSDPKIRQVLVMDPSQVSAALAGSHGEKVIVTHIKNNAGAIRGILNQR